MRKALCSMLLAALGSLPVAQAQPGEGLSLTGQPQSWIVRGEPYANSGLHGTRWGMSVDEVRAALAAAWPEALAKARVQADPLARTVALGITVPELAPAPGPAEISFVFGASDRRLVAVHHTWSIAGNPTETERASLLQAAGVLASELFAYDWPAFGTARGRVVAPGELVLFAAHDFNGGGVEIRLAGMALDVELPGAARRQEHRAAPPGPAMLRQSFVANAERPDVYSIPAGAF